MLENENFVYIDNVKWLHGHYLNKIGHFKGILVTK